MICNLCEGEGYVWVVRGSAEKKDLHTLMFLCSCEAGKKKNTPVFVAGDKAHENPIKLPMMPTPSKPRVSGRELASGEGNEE